MKKYLKLLLIMSIYKSFGLAALNEALLVNCQVKGHLVYNSCIVVPPTTSEQAAYCTTMFMNYKACLEVLNSPLPMIISKEPSAFAWSPFDICRFEPAHLALPDLCPSMP